MPNGPIWGAVIPAYAGVDLRATSAGPIWISDPRVRGGRPQSLAAVYADLL